jgi:AraC-like DNA-binding protein
MQQILSGLAKVNPFLTADRDAAQHYIGALFVPHRLDLTERAQRLDVCISQACIDGVSLIYHRHGASVRVRPEPLKNFFLLQIPASGGGSIRADGQDICCSSRQGVMISSALDIDMHFGLGCEQLIVRVEKSDLERHLEAELGHPLEAPLRFSAAVPLEDPGPQEIIALLHLMMASLVRGGGVWHSPLARRHMVALFLSGLLAGLDHNYRHELDEEAPPHKAGYLTKAKEFIAENVREAITPDDIAAAAHVSTRALYAAFRNSMNCSPMRYLRQLRLEKVRETLSGSDPRRASITTVATEYGFEHLGHFCASYKERFGELPRDTLRKLTRTSRRGN